MTKWAVFFGLFILVVIVLADTGRLGFLHAVYDFPLGDKLGHFLLYGLLTLVIILSVFEARPGADKSRLAVLTSLILAVLIGLEEFSQKWFPTRNFDLLDLTASYLGVACFAWLALRLKQ
jgi:polysaccharide biosynthesis protein VpsQ